MRMLRDALRAAEQGDLSVRLPISRHDDDAYGEVAIVFNALLAESQACIQELHRVSAQVAVEGEIAVRASPGTVRGDWASAVDAMNTLIDSMARPTSAAIRVLDRVAAGDLSQEMPVQLNGASQRGELSRLAETVNLVVGRLRVVSLGVSGIVREIGTEGKLGGQAGAEDLVGIWKTLIEDVNLLSTNLTAQVRNIAAVSTAIANGDLSQKITVETRGEIHELKNTINATVDQLRSFASEVTRVAREVGTQGRLGAQADVKGVSGTWQDLTNTVNMLARNLTDQVRNVAVVATAIANGDLSKKITVEAMGEILQLKSTFNTMVDQLRTFASEVTRVAKEVGTEGKLGGQAEVPGVAGTWKELTDNVNVMASNLTGQVRGIAKVVTAVADGDLHQRFIVEAKGEIAALADTINNMTATLRMFASQVTTVAREVGIDGKLGGQANVPGVSGTWKDLTDSVNMLAGNLTSQVRNIALVTTAVAYGDLSRKISVEAKGEILELKNTINSMVEQLRTFAAEVTRVAREVGTEGNLGGQAVVPEVGGTWKGLTDNVNLMASNLTSQVRGIVQVVTAVATGDLSKRLVVAAKGEIAALADTINAMTDTLRTFAEQVTTVAREVGVEGKLGGQAKVPGAAGTWKDLVSNVNQLAGNLTTQVRAISEVATAVTKGDLTRAIDVAAQGEVLALKDTINQMIANLRDTTSTNKEQDWLKTNLAKFSGMMQGQRSLESLGQLIMSELTPAVSAQLGTFYTLDLSAEAPLLKLLSTYGYTRRKGVSNRYGLGEGLIGQAALEKKTILVTQVPDDYIVVASSLGEAPPRNIVVLPILFEGNVRGVIELGSFVPFSPTHVAFLEQLAMSLGVVFNMISTTHRTEELLGQLKRSNVELEHRSTELEDKSVSLEEKAKQLALVSKYKSEFLANMSHELRTPLNSIIILSTLLSENRERHLSVEQQEYAKTILSSGRDLLALISQILDLSKIEAGRIEIEKTRVPLDELRGYVEQHFGPIAAQKRLGFKVEVAADAPAVIATDDHKLNQILKNLLSNAFKFTKTGSVELRIAVERDTSAFQSPLLRRAPAAVAFAITDTGIGIAPEKQDLVFEAFQQADASTSRVYGGTGLGLTISRELSRLLGGEIHLRSAPGIGSTFTLYLPTSPDDVAAPERPVLRSEPVHEAEPAAHLPVSEIAADALAETNILVIDDDVRNLFAVTSLLERAGASVLPAGSAKEAFEVLARNRGVDLVLMDMMLPEVDGYEATRQLRVNHFEKPIIAVTAKAMPGDRERAIEAGCNEFVAKPIEQARLVAVLQQYAGKDRKP